MGKVTSVSISRVESGGYGLLYVEELDDSCRSHFERGTFGQMVWRIAELLGVKLVDVEVAEE